MLKRRASGAVVAALLLGLFSAFMLLYDAAGQAASQVGSVGDRLVERASAAQATDPVTISLPIVGRNFPAIPVFGVQMSAINNARGLQHAVAANTYWVRLHAFHWDKIEPVNGGAYNWNTGVETSLKNASANGMQVIAIVHGTPAWAQKYPGVACGPIREDALDDYAQFLTDLVTRYSQPPYDVHYWELGNEPDVGWNLVSGNSVFGCWGEAGDPYYGGGYYAEMLKVAYPAIKAADPRAKVLIGGLLLDCDPTNPPAGKDCTPGNFLEGILHNGGAPYFDIVSFHGYPQYGGSLHNDLQFPSWAHRGGVVLGKIHFLREVMAKYGVDKPIIHTEGSLTCPETTTAYCNPPGSAFNEAQADYVVWLYVRNWANDIMGTIWYQFDGLGWRSSGMLDANQQPKPVYNAYKFLTEELGGAGYERRITQYTGLDAYEFRTTDKRIWVMWAPDGQQRTITLPAGFVKAYDKYGAALTPNNNQLTVRSPIYLELTP